MAVPNASRHSLSYHLPTISAYFETVAVVLGLIIIAHESQEYYVDKSHSELESFEMQTKVLTKTIENLHNTKERMNLILHLTRKTFFTFL